MRERPPFTMPEITVTEMVVWYPAANTQKPGSPALVCRVYANALCLYVFDPEKHRPEFKEGVRHLDDPECRENEFYREGGWTYSEAAVRLRTLEHGLGISDSKPALTEKRPEKELVTA